MSALRRFLWLYASLMSLITQGAPGPSSDPQAALLHGIRAATVNLAEDRCAGVLVKSSREAPPFLVTAAHCVLPHEQQLDVVLFDGRRTNAVLVAINRQSDVAVLSMPDQPRMSPLLVAGTLPKVGDELLFAGRNDRAPPLQRAHLASVGTCPSLPAVDQALFTTVVAERGDSGAPLVNKAQKVVGLVHGGAACHIATPSVEIAPVLAEALGELLQCRPEQELGVGGGSGATP